MAYQYFEDFAVGDRIPLGTHTMTEDEILHFATSYDPQPIHLDAKAAAETMYGGLIASGLNTMSVALRMMIETFRGGDMRGSPGWDEVRWFRPVRPGDVLTGECEILEARVTRSRPDVGVLRGKVTLTNQDGVVAMSAIPAWFYGRRP